MYDYHSHTTYSTDGNDSMEDMIKSAIKAGLKEIAITDHFDPDYPSPLWGDEFHADNYFRDLQDLEKKYHKENILVKGLEVGIQHGSTLDKCRDIVNSYDYDFIIGSFHCADGIELYGPTFYKGRSVPDSFRAFYKYVYDNLKAYKDYDVLGHMNVIDRYSPYVPPYDDLWDIIETILKMIIEDGKGLEINTSSFRYGMGDLTTPSHEILVMYKQLGGEIILAGSDAHRVSDVGYGLDWAYEKMKSVGFKYFTTYRRRQANFIKL